MNVAYHFVADANGNNFQCTDPQRAYYVPDVMESVFNQANDYFSDPRVNEFGSAGKVADARFRWPDNFDCSNAYFYPNGIDIGEDIPTIPGFFNIIFVDTQSPFSGGSGGNPTLLYNMLKFQVSGTFNLAGYARLLNHEFGHALGLPHAFSKFNDCDDMDCSVECGGPDPNCTIADCPEPAPLCHPQPGGDLDLCCYCIRNNGNNFMGYGHDQNAMTPCQWEQMIVDIFDRPRDYFKWCLEEEADLEINSGARVHWDFYKMLNQNVLVKRGASLTISCELRMGPGKKITVERGAKLVLLGAKISRLCPDSQWGGIYVEGNYNLPQAEPNDDPDDLPATDQSGIAYIAGSTIEHATAAITTARYWDFGNRNMWGGVVYVKNTVFQNNRRGVAFMKYNKPNNSHFRDCEFHGGYGGVSIWACRGIDFEQNLFERQSSYGIRGIDYRSEIYDFNQFLNCHHGIEVFSSYPSASEVFIGYTNSAQNEFNYTFPINESKVGVVVEASDVYVRNNVFRGYNIGCVYNDVSNYEIDENLFVEVLGSQETNAISLFNTGQSGISDISCNFIYTDQGIDAVDDNKAMVFKGNVFDTDWTDLHVRNDVLNRRAGINLSQGNEGKPVNNCFTPIEQRDHILTSSNRVDRFDYFYSVVDPQICMREPYQPNSSSPNYRFKKNQISSEIDPCKDEGGFTGSTLVGFQSIKDSIALLASVLANDPENTALQQKIEMLNVEKNTILHNIFRQELEKGNDVTLSTTLMDEGSVEALKLLYALKLRKELYEEAKSILHFFPIEEGVFVKLQNINLKVQQQQDTIYQLLPEEEIFLEQLADGKSANNGYAKSLLAILRGDSFEYAFRVPAENRQGRVSVAEPVDEKLRCHPNPVSRLLSISVSTNSLQKTDIHIYNSRGQVIKRLTADIGSTTAHFTVDTQWWPVGIYFVKLSSEGQWLASQKIIVLR
ncbi:MAG: zinc-dependent metalloprotease [Bacteroidota bacterium]